MRSNETTGAIDNFGAGRKVAAHPDVAQTYDLYLPAEIGKNSWGQTPRNPLKWAFGVVSVGEVQLVKRAGDFDDRPKALPAREVFPVGDKLLHAAKDRRRPAQFC